MRAPCPLDRRPLGTGNRRPRALGRLRSTAVRSPPRNHNRRAAITVASYQSAAAVEYDKNSRLQGLRRDPCRWDACALYRCGLSLAKYRSRISRKISIINPFQISVRRLQQLGDTQPMRPNLFTTSRRAVFDYEFSRGTSPDLGSRFVSAREHSTPCGLIRDSYWPTT
jgi:hypothetical protein